MIAFTRVFFFKMMKYVTETQWIHIAILENCHHCDESDNRGVYTHTLEIM